MKRFLSILLVLTILLSLAACSGANETDPNKHEFDPEGYKAMLDEAILLPSDYSFERVKKVIPQGEIDYNVNRFNEKGEDYAALVEQDFKKAADAYAETYGEDWKLSYTINSVDEKDAEGIKKYKDFDGFYFESYNIDTDKIDAVTFVKLTVKIEGSKDQNTKDKTIQCFCYEGVWYSFYAIRLGLKL